MQYTENQATQPSLYQKTGGFIKGICHPSGDTALLTQAGIGWVRMDVPWPSSAEYARFMERVAAFHQQGVRCILISPYPAAFVRNGIDPASAEGLNRVEALCQHLAQDFAAYHPMWQATNEMHMAHFRVPLTEQQAVDFIIASIRGLKKGDPDAAVGHNSVDERWDENVLMIERAVQTDYIGLDLYAGTWMPGDEHTYLQSIERWYALTKRPVVLMEFGFASLGDTMDEHHADVQALLASWGGSGLADAEAHMDTWLSRLPPRLRRIALDAAPQERLNTMKQEFFLHILKKWPCPSFLPHTEEGQAAFYQRLLPRLSMHPHLGGAVIYCMSDSERCFLCGEADCPLETAWGLLRTDGSKKPAYHAVKRAWGEKTI